MSWAASGWTKMVRIAAASISADPIGDLGEYRKCTRHLCPPEPATTTLHL